MYTVDFAKMIQYRSSDPTRHRQIKRELNEATKKAFNIKGVAGLRMQDHRTAAQPDDENVSSRDSIDSSNQISLSGTQSLPTTDTATEGVSTGLQQVGFNSSWKINRKAHHLDQIVRKPYTSQN